MPISYEWSFPHFDVEYLQEGYQNVVKVVHWVYKATDGTYTSSAYGTVVLPAPGQPFIDYEDLTPEIVQQWVEANLAQTSLEAMREVLVRDLERQGAPTNGTMPPPWQS